MVQIVDEIVEGGLEFVVFYYFDLIDFDALQEYQILPHQYLNQISNTLVIT